MDAFVLKVAVLNPNFYRSSGVTVAISRLIDASQDAEILWFFATCSGETHLNSAKQFKDAERFELMSLSPLKLWCAIFSFRRWLKATGANVLHLHHRRLAFLAGWVAWSLGIPVIYTSHSIYKNDYVLRFSPITKFIAVSESVRLNLLKFISPRFDPSVISNIAYFENERQILRGAKIRVCCIARFEAVKNHRLLLSAWSMLKPDLHDVELVLVGEGSLETELRLLVELFGIKDSVTFHGFTDEVKTIIEGCHFNILTSTSEGQGLVILEAASLYRPTLVTSAFGMRDCVPATSMMPNKVSVTDPIQLANTLRFWLANIDLVQKEGEEFYSYLKKIASPQVVFKRTLMVYLGAIQSAA